MEEESERSPSSSSCSSSPNLLRRIGIGGIFWSLALPAGDVGIPDAAEWSWAGLCEECGGGGLDDMEADEFGILHGIVSVCSVRD